MQIQVFLNSTEGKYTSFLLAIPYEPTDYKKVNLSLSLSNSVHSDDKQDYDHLQEFGDKPDNSNTSNHILVKDKDNSMSGIPNK